MSAPEHERTEEAVLRPINSAFFSQVLTPAFTVGTQDARACLTTLLDAIADPEVRSLLELVLDEGAKGPIAELSSEAWVSAVFRLLGWSWRSTREGWEADEPATGYAEEQLEALHLALMLEDPEYPYDDFPAAERYRDAFRKLPEEGTALAAFLCGQWDPFPPYPPAQVMPHSRRRIYSPRDQRALADWSWLSSQQVDRWAARLPQRLWALLHREADRLAPIELPETHEVLDYWLGRSAAPPNLAVAFSGLGEGAYKWIAEIGLLARLFREAVAAGAGLAVILTSNTGKQ